MSIKAAIQPKTTYSRVSDNWKNDVEDDPESLSLAVTKNNQKKNVMKRSTESTIINSQSRASKSKY